MVSYQNQFHVQGDVYDTFVQWMREDQIPAMLKLPGFLGAELLLQKGGALQSSAKEVKVLYRLKDEAALKDYLGANALEIRQRGVDKFPGQYSAHREIWLQMEMF
jgi:hypothetical protein